MLLEVCVVLLCVCAANKQRLRYRSQYPAIAHLDTRDILSALHWLTNAPAAPRSLCRTPTVQVQGLLACQTPGLTNRNCQIVSVISSRKCDDVGSLTFERYWAGRGCRVTLYHFYSSYRGNECLHDSRILSIKGLHLVRHDVYANGCNRCLHNYLTLSSNDSIDILKIQEKDGVADDFEDTAIVVLCGLYLNAAHLIPKIKQVIIRVHVSPRTLQDSATKDSDHGMHMWGAQQWLLYYASVSSTSHRNGDPPRQYHRLLTQANVSSEISSYLHTFVLLTKPSKNSVDLKAVALQKEAAAMWEPIHVPPIVAVPPEYCAVPSSSEDARMQQWIGKEMHVRCHPTVMRIPCIRDMPYDAFVPCQQELADTLAEDYAASKGWCSFSASAAAVPELKSIKEIQEFKRTDRPRTGVRLAFFFSTYRDSKHLRRLLARLHSAEHYYLIHIDPVGGSGAFATDVHAIASQYENVKVVSEVPIVYGASTASTLLARAMAWFVRRATGWDYFVPVTGSDYPLLPLSRMERIFASQKPPMPFVMAWAAGTSTHIFRLQKTHVIFEKDPLLAASIKATIDERGKVLGDVPMEIRSNHFGPPLLCDGQTSYIHLDNRSNKSGVIHDTQWLFARDRYPGRGRAFSEEDPRKAILPNDGMFRIWKKSDPATTGAYDRQSAEYITESVEGRKYYHFFKQTLLGSEEHYFVSLLYNWPRTRAFVQTLSAQIVWNTWKLGSFAFANLSLADRERAVPGFQTHTHYLTMREWKLIKGFSKRGMIFARKFSSSESAELLDAIDAYIHFNSSTIAGLYWPGFFETDMATPGKQLLPELYRNASLRRQGLMPYDYPASVRDIEARTPSF